MGTRPPLPDAGPLTGKERLTARQNGTVVGLLLSSLLAMLQPGPKGDKGDSIKGDPGPKGDPGMVPIGTLDVTEKIVVALSLPTLRTLDLPMAGVLATDRLLAVPASLGTGYAIVAIAPNGAGKVRVAVSVPALAVGATYSIPCTLFAIGRS